MFSRQSKGLLVAFLCAVWTQGVAPAQEPEANGKESIEVTFEKPEQDILTLQAMEKLEVIVESLEFANADLRNVIRIIGERLDINFIFDAEDIGGKVTLRLRNVRLRDALDSILRTRRLGIIPDKSGIFRIVPQEAIAGGIVETKTEIIQLNWLPSEEVMTTMEPFLTDHGKMQANQESNTIIITDVPPNIEQIRTLILQIDKAERQVSIEARLADVNIGAARELGTTWNASKINENAVTQRSSFQRDGSVSVDPFSGIVVDNQRDTQLTETFLGGTQIGSVGTVTDSSGNLLGSINESPLAGAGGILPVLLEGLDFSDGRGTLQFGDTIGILGDDYDLNAAFNFFESRGVVEILANPRVTTLNNVPAEISIIERIPYIEAVQGPSGNTTTVEVEFTDAGIIINVRPIITPNGFVRMEVQLKQMIFRERVGGGALDPPAIDERSADTNVIVGDAQTVVLGGLRQIRKLEGMEGMPWLHRIPLLGWLFKNKNYDQSKLELVLMMTPRIIEENITITDREKFWYDKIDQDWHLPDWFFDDVEQVSDRGSVHN